MGEIDLNEKFNIITNEISNNLVLIAKLSGYSVINDSSEGIFKSEYFYFIKGEYKIKIHILCYSDYCTFVKTNKSTREYIFYEYDALEKHVLQLLN